MKKRLWGVGLLAGLLASCNVSVNTPNVGSSNTLSLNNVGIVQSSYQLTQNVVDQNNRPIGAGTYIICDDRPTSITVNVGWNGGLTNLGVQFKGATTGAVSSIVTFGSPYSAPDTSGYGAVDIQIPGGAAPLSVGFGKNLSAQAITVTPVTRVNIIGYTYVQAIGVDQYGNYSNAVQSASYLPVANACA